MIYIVSDGSGWSVVVNGKVTHSGLTYAEAVRIRDDALTLLRTELAKDRGKLREVFGKFGDWRE